MRILRIVSSPTQPSVPSFSIKNILLGVTPTLLSSSRPPQDKKWKGENEKGDNGKGEKGKGKEGKGKKGKGKEGKGTEGKGKEGKGKEGKGKEGRGTEGKGKEGKGNEKVHHPTATPFQHAQCPEAHGPTDYVQWAQRTATTTTNNALLLYPVHYQPKYEPYVAICLSDNNHPNHHPNHPNHHSHLNKDDTEAPPMVQWFDPRFTGYGYNKMIFAASLHYHHHYTFKVCVGGCVLSEFHPPSVACRFMLNNRTERIQQRALYNHALAAFHPPDDPLSHLHNEEV